MFKNNFEMKEESTRSSTENSESSGINIAVIGTIILVIIIVLISFFLAKKRRLEEKKTQKQNKIQLIRSVRIWSKKTLLKYEKTHRSLPFYVRFILLAIFIGVHLFIYHFSRETYSHESGMKFYTHVLKDIAVWNASFLSVVFVRNFLVNGNIGKTEDIVTQITETVEIRLFRRYFFNNLEPNISTVRSQLVYDEQAIKILEKEIEQIDKELSPNGL